MKTTQCDRLAKMLTRKRGCTALEIIVTVGTVCPHKRLSDLNEKVWLITRKQEAGEKYGRYFGVPPKRENPQR